jgi:hypothetical protein
VKLSGVIDRLPRHAITLGLIGLGFGLAGIMFARGETTPGVAMVLLTAVLAAFEVVLWRCERQRERASYNCASCGRHHPEPCVIVTLSGRFPVDDCLHSGVCVVWCVGCAPDDVLHDSLMHHVHGADATKTMLVLRALARRGVGRVTWMSQETVDKLRKIAGSAVHDLTAERTVH